MRTHILPLLASVGLLVFFGLSSDAPAAAPPEWGEKPIVLIEHSARVTLQMELRSEGLSTKWTAQYASVQCGTSTLTSPWEQVNEGIVSGETLSHQVMLGVADPGEEAGAPVQLRHLTPATCYEAKFSATNADSEGPAMKVIPFQTRPVERPEVPKSGETENNQTPMFKLLEISDQGVVAWAKIESNGAQTAYVFEYALPEKSKQPVETSSAWKAFTTGTGEITTAEDYKRTTVSTTGLSPETTYYIRIRMTHGAQVTYQDEYASGAGELIRAFTTGTEKPEIGSVLVHNVTGSAAHISSMVMPHGLKTSWRFELAPPVSPGVCPPVSAPTGWSGVAGGEGTVTEAQAGNTPYGGGVLVGVTASGLSEASSYCVRFSVVNAAGEASGGTSFATEGPPSEVITFAVHKLIEGSIELYGKLNPKVVPTSEEQSVVVNGATGGTFTLSFEGHVSGPIAFNASANGTGSVESALRNVGLPVQVEGVAGGPYTVAFVGSDAGAAESLLVADGSSLTPSPGSSVSVSEVQKGGESFDAQYWFQYVTEKKFEESGWEEPEESSHTSPGSGETAHVVGLEVPGLKSGESYRVRLIAESAIAPGKPVYGEERSLTVPGALSVSGSAICANEGFRSGLSAALPDCRAYEQVTPVEKYGAQEPFHYKGGIQSALVVGEDGEHAVLEAPEVSYGAGAGFGGSPYLFSRTEHLWSVAAGAPQPETGIDTVMPQVYSADLTRVAAEFSYSPSQLSKSAEVEYRLGRLGGPYTAVASVPRQDVNEAEQHGEASGWVAGNRDLSKLAIESLDHELLGTETGTLHGSDLYEYSTGGGLRQLNVSTEGVTIGSCGARMVNGEEGANPIRTASPGAEGNGHRGSSSHSISEDGSRVFFEAVPAKSCTEPRHLFMRVNGSETVDIGAYRFLNADSEGRKLVLVNASDGEIVGYDTAAKTFESQPTAELAEERELASVGVPVRFEPSAGNTFALQRYTFWTPAFPREEAGEEAYRYDSSQHMFECVSCASSFDSKPKPNAYLGDVEGLPSLNGGLPDFVAASRDGDFAFFTTIAELVRQDVDEEVLPEYNDRRVTGEYVNVGGHASPSTDVYEWRAAGVDGCASIEGCLSLITDGRGGYLNLFLGTAHEGRDVFFYSRSVLSPWGHGPEGSIGEGNVYDARMGGGGPGPPPPPVGCEADSCAIPPAPPVDSTPASFTFSGFGNVVSEQPAKKATTKKKGKRRKAKRHRKNRKKLHAGRRGGKR